MGLIDQQALKAAGALSVVVLDAHSVQVIIGPRMIPFTAFIAFTLNDSVEIKHNVPLLN